MSKMFGMLNGHVMSGGFYRMHVWIFKRSLPLLINFRSHLKLVLTLRKPILRQLMVRHPRMLYKYLRGNYLLRSFTVSEALEVMNYHYTVLASCVSSDFFSRIFDDSPVLWEQQTGENNFKIRISFPRDLNRAERMLDHEGDIAIVFELDAIPLYVLCMTLVPEHITRNCWEINTRRSIFVGRIQGVPEKFDILRAATKALNDTTPPRLLLSAVEAIAQVLAVDTIIGVSSARQLSKTEQLSNFFDYDSFWQQLGASELRDGLFSLPAPVPDKPLEQIQQKHRSRTQAKRKFRLSVVGAVSENFAMNFMVRPVRNC